MFQDAFDSAGAATDAETRFAAGYHLTIALLETGRHAEAERLVEKLLVDYPDRQELILARRLLGE